MKKIKKLFLLASVLIFGVFALPLNAASNRIEIVTKARQYKFTTTQNTYVGSLRQEIVEEDLVNGSVIIELTLDNSKDTEIVYLYNAITDKAVDALDSSNIALLNSLTEKLFNTYGTENIKIGSALIGNEIELTSLRSTISETASGLTEMLDKHLSKPITNEVTLNDGITAAKTLFTNNSNNKILVVITSSSDNIPSNVDGIDHIIPVTISNINSNDILSSINSTLIPAKTGVAITMPVASYITSNFDVTLEGNPTDAKVNETTKAIEWNVGTLKTNEVRKIRYKLNLKSVVDDSIIGQNLTINLAPTIIFNGSTLQNTSANECSPVIKVLAEAIDNPKTGVANYIIFASTLLAVGAITYIVANKKVFNNI